MRLTLALAGVVAGIAATVLPVAPASADCQIHVTGCDNVCTLVFAPYGTVRDAAGIKYLPPAECTA